jgi:hypothetical protein
VAIRPVDIMGGAIGPEIDPNLKIKGGNWTVVKFFTLSVAYTSG